MLLQVQVESAVLTIAVYAWLLDRFRVTQLHESTPAFRAWYAWTIMIMCASDSWCNVFIYRAWITWPWSLSLNQANATLVTGWDNVHIFIVNGTLRYFHVVFCECLIRFSLLHGGLNRIIVFSCQKTINCTLPRSHATENNNRVLFDRSLNAYYLRL